MTRPTAYFLIGIALWVAVVNSGAHATLAGVALAMFIPLQAPEGTVTSPPSEPLLHHLEQRECHREPVDDAVERAEALPTPHGRSG